MVLFLPSLPASVTCRDIRRFIRTGLAESGWRGLQRFTTATNCSILRVTDPATGTTERHGLVRITPAKTAMLAIDVLKGRELKGARIDVRRYHQRSGPGGTATSTAGFTERRRRTLKVDLVNN
jgi:hypothetical protein